jgi:hypothetical protein
MQQSLEKETPADMASGLLGFVMQMLQTPVRLLVERIGGYRLFERTAFQLNSQLYGQLYRR